MRTRPRQPTPPEVVEIRRELWRYQANKPNKVPPADSPNRPALARLWWACFQATQRRPKLRTFTYCGVRFGVVFLGNRMGVMTLESRLLLVLSPGSKEALATVLNQHVGGND